jgi:hypothetical protein
MAAHAAGQQAGVGRRATLHRTPASRMVILLHPVQRHSWFGVPHDAHRLASSPTIWRQSRAAGVRAGTPQVLRLPACPLPPPASPVYRGKSRYAQPVSYQLGAGGAGGGPTISWVHFTQLIRWDCEREACGQPMLSGRFAPPCSRVTAAISQVDARSDRQAGRGNSSTLARAQEASKERHAPKNRRARGQAQGRPQQEPRRKTQGAPQPGRRAPRAKRPCRAPRINYPIIRRGVVVRVAWHGMRWRSESTQPCCCRRHPARIGMRAAWRRVGRMLQVRAAPSCPIRRPLQQNFRP